jgi:hypothetical protein
MSKYDKELDSRNPEYEKAVNDKRSGKEQKQPDRHEDHDRQGGAAAPEPEKRK